MELRPTWRSQLKLWPSCLSSSKLVHLKDIWVFHICHSLAEGDCVRSKDSRWCLSLGAVENEGFVLLMLIDIDTKFLALSAGDAASSCLNTFEFD